MKKLWYLLVVFSAVTSYGQLENPPTTPSERNWELRPDIISGGYSDQEGPYIYKLFNVYTCPPLPYDSYPYYINRHEYIFNLGYGDFKKHGAGTLILYDDSGEVQKENDGSCGLKYTATYQGGHGIGGRGQTLLFDGDSTAYIYKKEFVQKMEVRFSAETYTAAIGENLTITVLVYAGSGYYSLASGTRPAFLTMVSSRTWEGKCYEAMEGSIAIVVKDAVTGQECSASAAIVITEKSDDDNNSGGSGSSTSPSDPGGTATDPGSDNSGDDGDDSSNDDGSSVDDGDGCSAVDPGSSDDDSEVEPTDPGSDDNDDDDSTTEPDNDDDEPVTVTDPGNDDNTDEPVDPGSSDDDDSSINTDDNNNDDSVTAVPDSTDEPTDPGNSDSSESSDLSNTDNDNSTTVVSDDSGTSTDPSDNDSNDPVVIVVDSGSSSSDNSKIIVTDDSVTTVKSDNYDLAVFMGMFGAITGMNGSAGTTSNAPQAAQEAYKQQVNNGK
jgi:hypothetical protein